MPVIRAGFLPPIAAGFDNFYPQTKSGVCRSKSFRAWNPVRGPTGSIRIRRSGTVFPLLAKRLQLRWVNPRVRQPRCYEISRLMPLRFLCMRSALTRQLSSHRFHGSRRRSRVWCGLAQDNQGVFALAPTVHRDDLPSGTGAYLHLGSGLGGKDEEHDGHQQVARAMSVLPPR